MVSWVNSVCVTFHLLPNSTWPQLFLTFPFPSETTSQLTWYWCGQLYNLAMMWTALQFGFVKPLSLSDWCQKLLFVVHKSTISEKFGMWKDWNHRVSSNAPHSLQLYKGAHEDTNTYYEPLMAKLKLIYKQNWLLRLIAESLYMDGFPGLEKVQFWIGISPKWPTQKK